MSGATAAAPILADLAAELLHQGDTPVFTPPQGVSSLEICSFSGLRPGLSCRHRRQELFVAGTEPEAICTYHHSQEPWHRVPTSFAGWLHDRFNHHGAGRYRLAGFDTDLDRTFQEQASQARSLRAISQGRAPLSLGQNQTVHLHNTLFPALAASKDPRVTITSPLNGDRFLLPLRQETVALSLKASCRVPFKQVTWYVNGREHAATGPPYELPLQLGRGRHRLTVVGPDGLGDFLEIWVE